MTAIPQQVLWNIQLKHNIRNPELLQRALRILESDALRPTPAGNWIVKSNTKERTEYIIDLKENKCGCRAGQNGILCSHLLSVYLRIAAFEYAKKVALETGVPQVDIIACREQEVRDSRPQEKTEWVESI